MMQKKNRAGAGQRSKGSIAGKLPAVNSMTQLRATTAEKAARKAEAGLGGNRTGKASASGKRAQGRRDSKAAMTPSISTPPHATAETQRPKQGSMHVQVNTDHNVHGSEQLHLDVQSTVEAALGRFGERITRVEIHLSDDNGDKSHGDDKRCLMEARPAGLKPVVVTHIGATIDEAVDGAVEKMEKLLDHTFARLDNPKRRTFAR